MGKLFRPWDHLITLDHQSTKKCAQSESPCETIHSCPVSPKKDIKKDPYCPVPPTCSNVSGHEMKNHCPVSQNVNSDKSSNTTDQSRREPIMVDHTFLTPGYPNARALSELASLSRGELTAMGLLAPEPPTAHKLKRQRPKRFHCPHCQVAFSNNGQLRGHIRIHTGQWPLRVSTIFFAIATGKVFFLFSS